MGSASGCCLGLSWLISSSAYSTHHLGSGNILLLITKVCDCVHHHYMQCVPQSWSYIYFSFMPLNIWCTCCRQEIMLEWIKTTSLSPLCPSHVPSSSIPKTSHTHLSSFWLPESPVPLLTPLWRSIALGVAVEKTPKTKYTLFSPVCWPA